MLGVTVNPTMTPADEVISNVAERMGVGQHVPADPGRGVLRRPARRGDRSRPLLRRRGPGAAATCTECGTCMTGCRHGREEHAGRRTTSTSPNGPGYGVIPHDHGHRAAAAGRRLPDRHRGAPARCARRRRTFTAGQVVVAAGTYGTQKLLHRMKATGALPHLSGRLGALTRTNSEAILGAERFRSPGCGPLPRRRHHLLVPPRRRHPHRAHPLRARLQRHGRCCAPCWSTAAAGPRAG